MSVPQRVQVHVSVCMSTRKIISYHEGKLTLPAGKSPLLKMSAGEIGTEQPQVLMLVVNK